MDVMEAIVLIIAAALGSGGFLTVIISRRIDKRDSKTAEQIALQTKLGEERDKKSDERYAERREWEKLQLSALMASISTTETMAKTLTKKNVCNGELKEDLENLTKSKTAMYEHINDSYTKHHAGF